MLQAILFSCTFAQQPRVTRYTSAEEQNGQTRTYNCCDYFTQRLVYLISAAGVNG